MIWLIALIISLAYASFAEYIAHRWTMHKPGLGKIHIWEEHAVQHHAGSRNDVNIVLSGLTVFVGALPLLIFTFWLGWAWVAIVLLGSILYAALWSNLHASYHEVGSKWLEKFPLYPIWKNHHLNHHLHTNKNFGTVFVWTDYLFGTKI